MKPNKPKTRVAALLAFCWLLLFSDAAFSQAPFYQDKTITIIQGREPGALGDNRVRALIPYLRKYLPGNPAIVSEFMPGAGGRKRPIIFSQRFVPTALPSEMWEAV